MSKQAIQAAGERRWRWLAGLVVLALLLGVGSQFFNTQDAKADATISCGLDDAVPHVTPVPATIPVGETIYCHATVALAPTAVDWGETGTATITIANEVLATVGAPPTDNAEFTVTGAGTIVITLSYTDANGTHDPAETGQTVNIAAQVAGVTFTVDPDPALIGSNATVTFSIPAGLTYCSDGTGGDARAFTAPDQTITGATEVTTTPDANLDTAVGTHTTVVTSPTAGAFTVAISTHLAGSAAGAGCTTTTATVNFATVAGLLGDSVIRHYDVDAGSEDAADGSEGLLVGNNGLVDLDLPGVFSPNTDVDNDLIEDDDEAIGSLHTVCIVESPLTFTADAGVVHWLVDGTELSPSESVPGEISGDALPVPLTAYPDALCFQWASAAVGDQTVEALYDPDGLDMGLAGVPIRFDPIDAETGAPGTQPLVKEWNSIDVTKIVAVSGLVGGDPDELDFDRVEDLDGVFVAVGAIGANTGELAQWDTGGTALATDCERDINADGNAPGPNPFWCGARANVDGTVVTSIGLLTLGGGVAAPSKSFIEYAFGQHTTHYNGPIDGAAQTFSVLGTCGSAFIEDPATGNVYWLDSDSDPVTVPSSNYGVGITINAFNTDGEFDCNVSDDVSVLIETEQDIALTSAIDDAPDEIITVNFFATQVAKQPLLAWAGQRIVLPHLWSLDPTGETCFVEGENGETPPLEPAQQIGIGFPYARYEIERGDGAFVPNAFLGNPEGDDVFHASLGTLDPEEFGADPCASYAVYEQEFQGQVDIKATLEFCLPDIIFDLQEAGQFPFFNVSDDDCLATGFVYNFLVYYMEFEAVELGIVGGERDFHNNGLFDATGNAWDASTDTTSASANVSADVLLRARVKGWFKTDSLDTSGTNRPAEDGKPSGRYVMPDDWALLAGGDSALLFRPNYDIMLTPGGGLSCGSNISCSSSPIAGVPVSTANPSVGNSPVVGPFSLLDLGPGSGNSHEFAVSYDGGETFSPRETWLPDGQINMWDAPMPPALVTFSFVGETAAATATSSGFLKSANKFDDVYGGTNPYYDQVIPESPIINLLGSQNYLWDSWVEGLVYQFWQSVLVNRFPNSLASSPFANNTELNQIRSEYESVDADVTLGRIMTVYSDNHGEAMVFANGDFRLTYEECDTNVIGGGKHCAQGDKVGSSSVYAVADYPDFKKKPQIVADPVTIDWTWGGYKEITIEQGETDQFRYIVFHALDRDGFCNIPLVQAETYDIGANSQFEGQAVSGGVNDRTIKPIYVSAGGLTFTDTGVPYLVRRSVSLHPVLSEIDAENNIGANDPVESVDFTVDAGEGIIIGSSGGGTIDPTKRFAEGLPTYSTADNTTIKEFPTLHGSADECQAWIRVSNSLLGILNVIVVAHDDEGDIGFDAIVDFQGTFTYNLSFRWSLITWVGADNIPVEDALKGEGANDAGNDIFDEVTAVYGWDQAAQQWLGFFPTGVDVPGANDLTVLETGKAYWIAIKGPGSVEWTVATNVGG